MNYTDAVDLASSILDLLYFLTFALLTVVMLVLVRGKLEVVMWVAVAAYNLVFVVGLTISALETFGTVQHDSLIFVKRVSRFTIWLVHFYFVFAMKDVHLMLTCENPIQYKKKRRCFRVLKVLTYLTAGVMMMYVVLRHFLKSPDTHYLFEKVLLGVFSVCKLVIDILVYTLFAVLFTFFYNRKRQAYEDEGDELPRKAQVIRAFSMVLLGLNLMASLSTFVQSMLVIFVKSLPEGL